MPKIPKHEALNQQFPELLENLSGIHKDCPRCKRKNTIEPTGFVPHIFGEITAYKPCRFCGWHLKLNSA